MVMKSDFDHAQAKSEEWLDRVAQHLSFDDRRDAHTALRAALHALRDGLSAEQAVHLGRQLPAAIRRVYFEDWHLSPPIEYDRCVQEFCGHIGEELPPNFPLDAKNIAKGVFDVFLEQMDRDEIAKLLSVLPAPLKALWAKTAHNRPRTGSGGRDPRPEDSSATVQQQEPFLHGS